MPVKEVGEEIRSISSRFLDPQINLYFSKTIHNLLDGYIEKLVYDYVDLYQKTKDLQHIKETYLFLRVNDVILPLTREDINYFRKYSLTIAPEYEKQGEAVVAKLKKVKNDAKYLSMWLSLVFPSEYTHNTLKYCPKSLRPYLSSKFTYYINDDYERPKDREDEWKKAEKLISFYLGMNLLL